MLQNISEKSFLQSVSPLYRRLSCRKYFSDTL